MNMQYQPKEGIYSYYSKPFNIIADRQAPGVYKLVVFNNQTNQILEIVPDISENLVDETVEELKMKYLITL